VQKKEATSGNLSLAPRCARSINHIQGKNLPSKFCATAREVRGSCSSQVVDREFGGGREHCRGEERSRGKRKRRKAREGPIGCYRCVSFFKEFQLRPLFILFFPSVTSPFPLFHRLSLPLPFCLLRHEEHRICRGRGIRFHVYTQDGSDWPGLKPSQITP